jgi:hypothetical protein
MQLWNTYRRTLHLFEGVVIEHLLCFLGQCAANHNIIGLSQ